MFPSLEVAHLPSSSSFYSSVVQPLGLRYLSTEDGHFPSIVYGDEFGVPVFQLRQIIANGSRPLKSSHIVFTAPSAEAAEDAYNCAIRARHKNRRDSYPRHSRPAYEEVGGASVTRTFGGGGKIRISVCDFDRNTMDIVYRPTSDYPDYRDGPTVRRTQSTPKEASRIVSWNYDVVSSSVSPPSSRSGGSSRTATRRPYGGHTGDEPYSTLRRSVTEGPSVLDFASPRQHSSGISTGTVVGALLGVAAGAALGGAFTYSRTKGDRNQAPHQDYDEPPALPHHPNVSDPYDDRYGRYVEAPRDVEEVRRRGEYVTDVDYRPAPEYIARYGHVASSRGRVADEFFEERRGRYDPLRSRASSGRARSESATNRQPLLLAEGEHRSHVSSRNSRHPPIVQRSYTYESPEQSNYLSAKSHHSSNTIRGPPPPGAPHHIVSRSRSKNRAATTTIKVFETPSSRNGHNISARDVSLQRSGAGSNYFDWDDDAGSVAPSDSISNIGNRRSGRSHR